MSFRFSLRAFFAVGCWVVLLATNSQALTLADLFQGSTITALDKVFSNFTLLNSQTTNGAFADTTQITVTALTDDPANPGIKFTAPLDVLGTPFGHTGGSSVDLE